jgi:hypothetical protein
MATRSRASFTRAEPTDSVWRRFGTVSGDLGGKRFLVVLEGFVRAFAEIHFHR